MTCNFLLLFMILMVIFYIPTEMTMQRSSTAALGLHQCSQTVKQAKLHPRATWQTGPVLSRPAARCGRLYRTGLSLSMGRRARSNSYQAGPFLSRPEAWVDQLYRPVHSEHGRWGGASKLYRSGLAGARPAAGAHQLYCPGYTGLPRHQ
jgi:hypothetical protein